MRLPFFLIVCATLQVSLVDAWATHSRFAVRSMLTVCHIKSSWSIADDWESLSAENPHNQDSADRFNQRQVQLAAAQMQEPQEPPSKEAQWLNDAIRQIFQTQEAPAAEPELDEESFLDSMGNEIAMLVRCNQSPEDMLIQAGRALPPLTDQERNDVSQLVSYQKEHFQATPFLKSAVSTMFQRHALPLLGKKVMDSAAVASWMRQSLGSDNKTVGPHDPRVAQTLSKYSAYGTGYLEESDLERLYLSTVVGDAKTVKELSRRQHEIEAVWRDIRSHGIQSPAEVEREKLLHKIQEKYVAAAVEASPNTLLDECEIVDDTIGTTWTKDDQGEWQRTGRSSHELVELAFDKKTPLYMKDGDFVFIDEESCIGCMQCVSAAPSSFQMLDDGRARTFAQRKSPDVVPAVASCPVNCMHYVGFDRLKELETARDSPEGDGRKDHRHFGASHQHKGKWHARTPLHVSGRDSDAAHKSSWYHYLVNKCHSKLLDLSSFNAHTSSHSLYPSFFVSFQSVPRARLL